MNTIVSISGGRTSAYMAIKMKEQADKIKKRGGAAFCVCKYKQRAPKNI